MTAQGAPIIQRILRGAQGSQRAVQAQYLISIGDDWIAGQADSRTPGELFDVTAVDNLLLATRLAAPPRLEAEVIPAWRAYQRQIAPGSPVAKFVLYMDPAPVRLGNYQSGLHDTTLFTDSDFRRGGRQVSPDLIEFYTKDDPTSIRIDLWVDTHPHIEGRERIFEAKLRVEKPTVSIWSFGDPYDATILPGDYKVLLSLVNRGKSSEQSLTEEEWFSRSDLERYEVGLKRHASETDPEK